MASRTSTLSSSGASRRSFVSGAINAAGVLAVGSAAGALPTLASADSGQMAMADYEAMVGGYFAVAALDGHASSRVKLFSMQTMPASDGTEQFSLTLYSSQDRPLPPGRYALWHYRRGQYFEAYLEPIETKLRRRWYRADFALLG